MGTNAPSDLLALRSTIMSLTGLPAVSVGIVGDSAHAATGGYHEGKTDLINAGVWSTDYSVRLTRDRNAATDNASAMDIGYQWPRGGNASWLRFNQMLVAYARANRPELGSIRAINYSPNGSTRYRTDRESGWTIVSSSDSVDVHTHIEWYRDTIGNRGGCIDFLTSMIRAAIAGQTTVESNDMALTDQNVADLMAFVAYAGPRLEAMKLGAGVIRSGPEAGQDMAIVKTVNGIALDGIDVTALGNAIAAQVIAHHDALTDADLPVIKSAVASVLHTATAA